MKLREACINHLQKHKERFSKVSIVERVCDVMQVGLIVMMNIGINCAGGYFTGVCHSVGGGGCVLSPVMTTSRGWVSQGRGVVMSMVDG